MKQANKAIICLSAPLMLAAGLAMTGCTAPMRDPMRVPSMDYANNLRGKAIPATAAYGTALAGGMRAHANDALYRAEGLGDSRLPQVRQIADDTVAAEAGQADYTQPLGDNGVRTVPSQRPMARDYLGPLSLGDPGVSASLWREGRELNLVRDYRAYQPYDLLTVSVDEKSEGSKQADTDVKQDSTFSATIGKLLGLEQYFKKINPSLDPADPLIQAKLASEFKSTGETTRKGALKAKISAMVMEVLPSGILRIEGEKILSVNNEDETMVISGLVRPEDVSSDNEVDSSKVANVRVDYFGKGSVGSAQNGGWLGNIIRSIWPL